MCSVLISFGFKVRDFFNNEHAIVGHLIEDKAIFLVDWGKIWFLEKKPLMETSYGVSENQ